MRVCWVDAAARRDQGVEGALYAQREVLVLDDEQRFAFPIGGGDVEVGAAERDGAVVAHDDLGVHVGQDDVELGDVRQLPGTLRIGVSTHDAAQLEQALLLRPDYVAFGPIFATSSKEGADPALGVAELGRAASRARKAALPLVAIGGLTLSVAGELARHGVVAAVISDLLAAGHSVPQIASRAQAWQSALSAP